MKKHKIVSIMSFVALLGGLFSCRPKTNTDEKENPDSIAGGDTVTVNFWHTFGDTIEAEVQRAADDFSKIIKENENVNVKIEMLGKGGYSDILTAVNSSFNSNNTPSLAIAYPDHVAEYLSHNDGAFVVNMDQYINSDTLGFGKEAYLNDGAIDDIVPAFLDEGRHYAKKGTYSLPLLKSTEIMLYNVEAVDSYALAYSKDQKMDSQLNSSGKVQKWLNTLSWNEFMDFCSYIKTNEDKVKGMNFDWPAFYDSDANLFITECMQKKIPFISLDDKGNGKNDFNNDQAKAMVKELKGQYDMGLFATKDSGGNGEYGSNYFKDVRTLFDIGSTGGAGYNVPSGGAFHVGVAQVPAFNKENRKYVSQGLTATILRAQNDLDGKKAEYAWKFLKYLTSASVNAKIAIRGSQGYMPVRSSSFEERQMQLIMSETDYTADLYNMCKDEIDNSAFYNTVCFKGSATSRTAVGGLIAQVMLGKKNIDEAFNDAYSTAQKAM